MTEVSKLLVMPKRFSKKHLIIIALLFAIVGGIIVVRSFAYRTYGSGNGVFYADCGFTTRNKDDPIVFPGGNDKAHSHDFYGAKNIDENSTTKTIQEGSTTCLRPDAKDPSADKAAYWVPTLYVDGKIVEAPKLTAQYTAGKRKLADIKPFPEGLVVIAGTGAAGGGPSEINAQRVWFYECAGGTIAAGNSTTAPTCEKALKLRIAFPDCWDGVNIDSPNHKSHMAYSAKNGQRIESNTGAFDVFACPPTHPVQVPILTLTLEYPTKAGPTTQLSTGNGDGGGAINTAHADFMNGWDQTWLDRITKNCLNIDAYCGGTDQAVAGHAGNDPNDVDGIQNPNPTDTSLPPSPFADPKTDNVNPTVSLDIAPINNTFISGTTKLTANVSDNVGVTKVSFYTYPSLLLGEDKTPPFEYNWDTTKFCNCPLGATVRAFDAAGNVAIANRNAIIVNEASPPPPTGTTPPPPPAADTTAPTVTITSPGSNATVSGTTIFSANATDASGISEVEFYLDGQLNLTKTIAPYSYQFDTTKLTNGPHTLQAKATDNAAAPNEGTSTTVTFTVSNVDQTPPTKPGTPTVDGQPTINSIKLKWAPSSDNVAVKSYMVQRKFTGETDLHYNVVGVVNAPLAAFEDKGLAANTKYTYRIQAFDTSNNASPYSDIRDTATVAQTDDIAPTTPGNLQVNAPDAKQVNLTWDASTDASGIKGYNVYRNGSATPLNGTTLITSTNLLDGTVQPATSYTYEVEAIDGATNISARASVTVTTPPLPPAPSISLLGNKNIEPQVDGLQAGRAEAFKFTASASGSGKTANLFLDASSTANNVRVAVYATHRGHPQKLLGKTTITSPKPNAWNSVALPNTVSLTAGKAYWIAVLSPTGSGALKFRTPISPTLRSEQSQQNNLSDLPATWSVGASSLGGPISGYVSQ